MVQVDCLAPKNGASQMHRCRGAVLVPLILGLIFSTLQVSAQSKSVESPEVLYAKSKGAVVTILTFDSSNNPVAQGSGFIVAKDRIVTNYHVVSGSTNVLILFNDGTTVKTDLVAAGSKQLDLVVLAAQTGNRPFLRLGDELQLKVGQPVYAIGAPQGLIDSLSNGLVSAFREDNGRFLIQTTVAIAHGSSGGPLFDSSGEVVGVTTLVLKDGNFGFAVAAGDLKHLIRAPLPTLLQLSYFTSPEPSQDSDRSSPSPNVSSSVDDLATVRALYDQKKYSDALEKFHGIDDSIRQGFDGQLLLCQIEDQIPNYTLALQACDAALELNSHDASVYGAKALALFGAKKFPEAETSALTATQLSDDKFNKTLLASIYYSEEKYDSVIALVSTETKDDYLLTLLAGAELYSHNYDAFRTLNTRLTDILGAENGWQLFLDGATAQRELNFDLASQKFKKCDQEDDFVDPICIVSESSAELMLGSSGAAQSDIDNAVQRYPYNHTVLSEAIFIHLVESDKQTAEDLHARLLAATPRRDTDDSTDCLYYYGLNQPSVATQYCEAMLKETTSTDDYTPWSNAGYVALDNGKFREAVADFLAAQKIYGASKTKHTVTQELDLSWGLALSAYYAGDTKDAKSLLHDMRRTYPGYSTVPELKQLPLVWSGTTQSLITTMLSQIK